MRSLPFFLFFLLLALAGISQRTIKGRVVNAATGDVIASSSVFISSTSKGTTSNSAGHFELNDVPAGKHELVISCIGYETNVFSFSDEQLPLQLKIELTIKVKEMENVTVEPSTEEGWDKWGKTFMSHFAGNTENGLQCKVKNEEAVKFRYYKKSNRLIAYCNEPVQLENKGLGYVVNYQLENFEINFSERSMLYLGYSLFVPMEMDRKGSQDKWQKRREEAYNGSIMHFMRSLYTNKLFEEGFEVRWMSRIPNYEKQRIKPKYIAARNSEFMGTRIKLPKDTLKYYESLMSQTDYTDVYGASLLTADSLVIPISGEFKAFSFDEYILITYKNEKEEPAYLKSMFLDKKPGPQTSFVILLNDKVISLDKNGNYYDPRDFFASGYWSWNEKMGNTLPLDYEKDK